MASARQGGCDTMQCSARQPRCTETFCKQVPHSFKHLRPIASVRLQLNRCLLMQKSTTTLNLSCNIANCVRHVCPYLWWWHQFTQATAGWSHVTCHKLVPCCRQHNSESLGQDIFCSLWGRRGVCVNGDMQPEAWSSQVATCVSSQPLTTPGHSIVSPCLNACLSVSSLSAYTFTQWRYSGSCSRATSVVSTATAQVHCR